MLPPKASKDRRECETNCSKYKHYIISTEWHSLKIPRQEVGKLLRSIYRHSDAEPTKAN